MGSFAKDKSTYFRVDLGQCLSEKPQKPFIDQVGSLFLHGLQAFEGTLSVCWTLFREKCEIVG